MENAKKVKFGEMDEDMNRNLFDQTISDKIFGIK